jgi:hypothetical protein
MAIAKLVPAMILIGFMAKGFAPDGSKVNI